VSEQRERDALRREAAEWRERVDDRLAALEARLDALGGAVDDRGDRAEIRLGRHEEALRRLVGSLRGNALAGAKATNYPLRHSQAEHVLAALAPEPGGEGPRMGWPQHEGEEGLVRVRHVGRGKPQPLPEEDDEPPAATDGAQDGWPDAPLETACEYLRAWGFDELAAALEARYAPLPPALPEGAEETLREAADSLVNSALACQNRGETATAASERRTVERLRALADALAGGGA
jgi:hypothetical protein